MSQLPRVLKIFDVSVLASASMAPAYSLAATAGPMIAVSGGRAAASLIALSTLMLGIALGYAELARRYPDAGSSFAWIRRAFGFRMGAYGAWLLLLSNFFATLATALPAGVYTLELIAPAHATDPRYDAAVGALFVLASGALLAFGLRPTALFTTLFLGGELAVLGAGVLAAARHPAASAISATHLLPTAGSGGLIAAMVLGIWMTDGWEISAAVSEEAHESHASGRGGVTGLVLVTVVTACALVSYERIGTVAGFAAHEADALAYVADLLGPGWHAAFAIAVLVSTSASLWTTALYLARSVYAMGRDGVLPSALGRLDARGVPMHATLAVGAGVVLCTLLCGFLPSAASALNLVLSGTSVFLGLLFACTAGAAVRLFAGDRGASRLRTTAAPAIGGGVLLLVIAVSAWQAEPRAQAMEVAFLLAGVPLALRARGRAG